jgi:hypothetical protein
MELQELYYDRSRQVMVHVHDKREYKIIKHKGKERYYIQHSKGQLTVTSKVNGYTDWWFDYVFGGLFQRYPCPAIDYFIYRHRMGNRINAIEYKNSFLNK